MEFLTAAVCKICRIGLSAFFLNFKFCPWCGRGGDWESPIGDVNLGLDTKGLTVVKEAADDGQ